MARGFVRRRLQCWWCHHSINWWLRLLNIDLRTSDNGGPLCWRCWRRWAKALKNKDKPSPQATPLPPGDRACLSTSEIKRRSEMLYNFYSTGYDAGL